AARLARSWWDLRAPPAARRDRHSARGCRGGWAPPAALGYLGVERRPGGGAPAAGGGGAEVGRARLRACGLAPGAQPHALAVSAARRRAPVAGAAAGAHVCAAPVDDSRDHVPLDRLGNLRLWRRLPAHRACPDPGPRRGGRGRVLLSRAAATPEHVLPA